MNTRSQRALVAIALASILGLTACSGGDETDSTTPTDSGSSQSVTTANGGEAADNGAAAAGIDINNVPKAIATQTIPADREVGVDTVKVDLLRLERKGKIVEAVFALTPKMTTPGESVNIHGGLNGAEPNVRLIDPVNLKLYKTIELANSNGKQLETNIMTAGDFVEGKPVFVWGAVAAPPEEVSKVDVLVFESGVPFKDVPLS
ncbi:hypothetical protein N802_05300 [Knoellia sinensis KCTC 19936]|uniref:Lipoprotein n=1 Tax=Knoellia sinensis KCTC 19936 TaxID=1385520 RepID=A0A0A0J4N0_9MICO|nr:hypothetical protein [Knoellia sinensis]KGN31022.1 hypothetical protein N802_05300 [Knoellia sinensis KCTC 19936]